VFKFDIINKYNGDNMTKIPSRGMRDILPKSMELRNYLLDKIKFVYQSFGFNQIETPCIEHIENLTSGQGADNEKLIFKILKRGEKLEESMNSNDIVDSGLRYDLTLPLARFYANNMNELPSPFRAFQYGHVWRAERPQKGRFRQIMQVDIDILGEKDVIAEIELLLATTSFFKELGLKDFKILINSRLILKKAIQYSNMDLSIMDSILISLDKLDKIGNEKVRQELLDLNIKEDSIDKYLTLYEIKDYEEFCRKIDLDIDIKNNFNKIIEVLEKVQGVKLVFDPSLVRGMGYYTGVIFEIKTSMFDFSIAGGGRYDKMIEKFTNCEVNAVGISIGFERLAMSLEELNFEYKSSVEKLAIIIDKDINQKSLEEVMLNAMTLRSEGKIVKVIYKNKNYRFQLDNLEKEGYKIYE